MTRDTTATVVTGDADPDADAMLEIWTESDPRRRGRLKAILGWPETSSSFVGLLEFDPGDLEMPHQHSAEEVVYVLEGSLEMTIDARTVRAEAGQAVSVPANTWHHPKNVGAGTLRAVAFLPSAVVIHVFAETVAPLGTRVFVTPPCVE